jgi:hypothetical protein
MKKQWKRQQRKMEGWQLWAQSKRLLTSILNEESEHLDATHQAQLRMEHGRVAAEA